MSENELRLLPNGRVLRYTYRERLMHWSAGLIGYFPTYALGNLIAGQPWRRAHADLPELEDLIARGELGALREWLREHVHRHGRKLESRELLRRATGQELSVEPWLAYLERKLLDAGLLLEPVRDRT